MGACRRVVLRDPSLYPRHAPWSAGTISWADRLAILTLDACHVQTGGAVAEIRQQRRPARARIPRRRRPRRTTR
jgi:hypothetical protein